MDNPMPNVPIVDIIKESPSLANADVKVKLDQKTTKGDAVINVGGMGAERPVQVERKSYQFKALAAKTWSYQKRQMSVNICCVVVCPFMMVLLAGALSLVLQNFSPPGAGDPYVVPYRYCSRDSAINSQNIPLILNDSSFMSNKDNAGKVLGTNFFIIDSVSPAASSLGSQPYPCFINFENDYEYFSPYARDPGVARTRDSTYLSDPFGGFFNQAYAPNISTFGGMGPGAGAGAGARNGSGGFIPTARPVTNYPLFSKLQEVQKYSWNYVFAKNGIDVGFKNPGVPIPRQNLIPAEGSEPNRAGFFGNTITQYYNFPAGNTSLFFGTDQFWRAESSDPDQFIYDEIMNRVYAYEEAFQPQFLPNGTTINPQIGGPKMMQFFSPANLNYTYPFFGAIHVERLETGSGKLAITLQVGRVSRLRIAMQIFAGFAQAFGFPFDVRGLYPDVGERFLYQVSRITNAMFKSSANPTLRNTRISHSFLAMPRDYLWPRFRLGFDIGVLLGKTTFPFGLSFLIPIFVLILVKEKEDRIQVMMRMHGLTSGVYYLSHYIHFMILQVFCSIVFIIAGVIFRLKFFTETDPGVFIILLLVWANAMVAISFVLSLLFNKSRLALLATFGIVFLSCMFSLFEDLIFKYAPPPDWYFIWPFWAFFRGLNVIGDASSGFYRPPYKMSDLTGGDEVLKSILYLLVEGIILFLLTAYLNQVIPTEYGISRPWHFPFSDTYRYVKKNYLKNQGVDLEMEKLEKTKITPEEEKILLEKEDDDVRSENKKVHDLPLTLQTYRDYPLIVKDVRKVYSGGKVANKRVNLAVEKNIVFGLLGANGAGKTTLIQMMTGLYPPTSGNAYVAGYSIQNDMQQIYMNIGVCPQHDIVWDDLTVEEHLLFYARIRGIPPEKEKSAVEKAIRDVELQEHAHKLAKSLSGGQKRRLSIAIAVTGDVPLVFLDEPTTGLDPEVRRTVWNVIQNAKIGKTIILTTHSMEEADILSSRIGIMAKGILKCVGSPLHLKRKYGRGFKLTVSFLKEAERAEVKQEIMSHDDAIKWIESRLPANFHKIDQGGIVGNATYEFDDDSADDTKGVVSTILEQIETNKALLGIEDWGISLSTLDEVFLTIVSGDDSNADVK